MANIIVLFGFYGLFRNMFDSLSISDHTVSDMYADTNRSKMLSYHAGAYSHNKEATPESPTTVYIVHSYGSR